MSDTKRNDLIENAIAGGLIGAALGALLTGRRGNTIVAGLLGAAIGASIKAQRKVENIGLPVYYEEEGVIYKVFSDGTKEKVKEVKARKSNIPKSFSID